MAKTTIRYSDYFAQTIQRMRQDGLLLVTADAAGKPNVMTIGWGAIGSIWGRPVFIVLVRPSRHTYSRLEEVGDFTVNVPSRELAAAVNLCGTVSGRDHDKFKEAGLTLIPGRQVRPPIIAECVVHYECRTLHRNDVVPEALVQAVLDDAYPAGDFHRVYFGEIVAAYAEEDAVQRLLNPALRRSRELSILCSPRITTTTPRWCGSCPRARAYSCHIANPVRAKAPARPHTGALLAQVACSWKLNALRAPKARMTENHPARLRRG